MQEARTRWALVVVALFVFGGSGTGLFLARRPAPPPVVITPAPAQADPPVESPPAPTPSSERTTPRLFVDVAGSVRRPSLYPLPPGSRVMQAIQAAGGPTRQADLDAVNLAEKVQDGEKVYIPARQSPATAAMTTLVAPPGNSLGHASALPPRDVPGDAPPAASDTPLSAPTRTSKHASRSGKSDKLTSPAQGQVNLNTAGADELQRLPGVGPAMAARILAYRAQAHGFQKIDELMEVGGIGPKKFAKMAPFVTVD